MNANFLYGKRTDATARTTQDQLRVTINASKCNVYTNLKTILINGSTGGQSGTQVKIEKAQRGSESNFTTVVGTYDWSGWSGWNSYPINIGAFGGGEAQTGNIGALRFTFTYTNLGSTAQVPSIQQIMMFGTTAWIAPSNMANYGTIYSWDYEQTAKFPGKITATGATFSAQGGFNYSGIQSAAADKNRNVWFSDTTAIGRPVYSNNFMYNPAKNLLTVGSITGSAAKVANALKINNKTFDGSSAVDVGTITIDYGGTGATTATGALINLNGNAAKGSATVPIYWTGSAWATITSYDGKASTAGTADKVANALSVNGKTYDGSAAIDVGIIGAAYGGSGKTTLEDSTNAFLNALSEDTAVPVDADYYISQSAGGGTTTTTYHRRPVSALYNYIKGKTDTLYLPLSGGTLTGQVTGITNSGSWITMSHSGSFNMSTAPASSSAASVVTAKTTDGSWGIGTLQGTNNLYFVYGTDANYEAGSNKTTNNVYVSDTGGIYGAVWNDYAEFRTSAEQVTPGQVVYSDNRGELHKTTERLQTFEGVVSDTFGFAIGETDKAKTPLAVAGRVLVYPDEDRYTFHAGDAVCAGKFGTVSKMTREEIIAYPDRIVGIVSEIPEYETWGSGNVPVYNRIWIRVK